VLQQLQRLSSALRRHGPVWAIQTTIQRTVKFESRITKRNQSRFANKVGLELGGPSVAFSPEGPLPVYAVAARVDNVNFAPRTRWEAVDEGLTFRFDESKPPGRQFVDEATALSSIETGGYDFTLVSHMLEHTANPLKVLEAVRRILKPTGVLLLILPDPRHTFDHHRPVTTLEHLVADYERGTGEDDLTHLPEIVELHDLTADRGAPQSRAEFRDRCLRNSTLRCMHHHVFDEALVREVLGRSAFRVLDFSTRPPHDLICLAARV
jgi:SAM-dependent methyltransferase